MVQRPAIQEAATPWGILTSLDLYGCNPETIRNAEEIRRFVVELCERIDMKRFGECQVVHFGQDKRVAGYSMIQLIETSLISGHFANQSNAAYIDIFSCKPYDPDDVTQFSREFFGAEFIEVHVARRM
jgi:S-adenosylmethionine/arginine decarboxylase-like enzyme